MWLCNLCSITSTQYSLSKSDVIGDTGVWDSELQGYTRSSLVGQRRWARDQVAIFLICIHDQRHSVLVFLLMDYKLDCDSNIFWERIDPHNKSLQFACTESFLQIYIPVSSFQVLNTRIILIDIIGMHVFIPASTGGVKCCCIVRDIRLPLQELHCEPLGLIRISVKCSRHRSWKTRFELTVCQAIWQCMSHV